MLNKSSMLLAATSIVAGAWVGYADPFDHERRGSSPYVSNSETGRDCGTAGAPGPVGGGVMLSGLAGSLIAHDMDCGDRRYAFASFYDGFEGLIDHRYDWRNGERGNHGNFIPVREYSRDGNTCRDFVEMTYRNAAESDRTGSACRRSDGNWYLE